MMVNYFSFSMIASHEQILQFKISFQILSDIAKMVKWFILCAITIISTFYCKYIGLSSIVFYFLFGFLNPILRNSAHGFKCFNSILGDLIRTKCLSNPLSGTPHPKSETSLINNPSLLSVVHALQRAPTTSVVSRRSRGKHLLGA